MNSDKLMLEAIVREEYRRILRREADPVGLDLHIGLDTGSGLGAFRDAVTASLSTSSEAALLRPSGVAISTDEEVREFLRRGEELFHTSHHDFIAHLNDHWLEVRQAPADPFSPEYLAFQMHLYERLAETDYSVSNEAHDFSFDEALRTPYPYVTGSGQIVADQLLAWSAVIRTGGLNRGDSVLEFGPGVGGLALQLAQMGCEVSVIDIEPKYLDIIDLRAKQIGVYVEPIEGQFLDIGSMNRKFDALVFFESFHHCIDHLRLLDMLPQCLNPGGRLILAGETVDARLPYPWGINCFGHGVWAISKHKWMELAFREDYLLAALKDRGWSVSKHNPGIAATAITYVCQRH